VPLLLLRLGSPARAADDSAVAREDWKVLGWNEECGVALQVLGYPKIGAGIQSEPIETHIGSLTIVPEKEDARLEWNLEAYGMLSWDRNGVAKLEGELRSAGYTRAGFPEEIRGKVGSQPGLADTLLSTNNLKPRLKSGWPGEDWRLTGMDFSPSSTCALLVYARRSDGLRHSFLLVRVYAPRARLERARAHTENARLLFAEGDLASALAEARTGARLAPELAVTRYHHAALLALNGQSDEAVDELAEAVKLDPKYRAQARDDADFESLRERDDFQKLTRGK